MSASSGARSVTVTVHILDREYQVACAPEERPALEEAARHLDGQMREIRSTGKIVGLERIAVMAALNLSHELLTALGTQSGAQKDVDRLSERVTAALGELRQFRLG